MISFLFATTVLTSTQMVCQPSPNKDLDEILLKAERAAADVKQEVDKQFKDKLRSLYEARIAAEIDVESSQRIVEQAETTLNKAKALPVMAQKEEAAQLKQLIEASNAAFVNAKSVFIKNQNKLITIQSAQEELAWSRFTHGEDSKMSTLLLDGVVVARSDNNFDIIRTESEIRGTIVNWDPRWSLKQDQDFDRKYVELYFMNSLVTRVPIIEGSSRDFTLLMNDRERAQAVFARIQEKKNFGRYEIKGLEVGEHDLWYEILLDGKPTVIKKDLYTTALTLERILNEKIPTSSQMPADP